MTQSPRTPLDKRSVSFIPGFAVKESVWDDQKKLLGPEFKIVGGPADFIIAWSMGVFEAVRRFFNYPSRVKKMVFVSGTPKFIKDDTFEPGLSLALFRNLERKLQADQGCGLKYFYDLIGNGKTYPPLDIIPEFKKNEIFSSLERLKKEDIRALLLKIDIPVLLIHGDQDQICRMSASKYMAGLIPRSRLAVFPGAGHAPFLEQPEKFHLLVKDFMQC